MKILVVASEAMPFIRTGGLADSVGALTRALAATGADVRLVIPRYSGIDKAMTRDMKMAATGIVNLAWRQLYYGVKKVRHHGVTTYFIDNEWYFKRDQLYGYQDDAERFAYFCRAVLAMLPEIGFHPDIIHCHDWHTGLVGTFLKEDFKSDRFYKGIKVIYTIHSFQYQGSYPPSVLRDVLGLPQNLFSMGNVAYEGRVNYMKAGIVYADAVTTVHSEYDGCEAELAAEPGPGLDRYLWTQDLSVMGIINGIDDDTYNPLTDAYIHWHYTDTDAWAGKQKNKEALRNRIGLKRQRCVPLMALMAPFLDEEGARLAVQVLETLPFEDLQLVIIGTQDCRWEASFCDIAAAHPTQVVVHPLFPQSLIHELYAAADLFLLPSRHESYELSQLIALRYGAIPIVYGEDPLKTHIQPFDKYRKEGNGLVFYHFTARDCLYTIQRAQSYYEDATLWQRLVHNAMTSDYSWRKTAQAYVSVYKQLLSS